MSLNLNYVVINLFLCALYRVKTSINERQHKLFNSSQVCHFKKGTEICNYSYANTILSVKLNRARLVVCLEEALYIHNIRLVKELTQYQ